MRAGDWQIDGVDSGDSASIARQVIQIEIEGLKCLGDSLGDEFNDVISDLLRCFSDGGKVVLSGIGKSGNISQKIAATLTSTGSPAVVLNSVDALHGDLGIIQPNDVILMLSFSGESDELAQLLPALKRFSSRMIAITGNRSSSIAMASDRVLEIPVKREACPFNLAPTASTTAMMAIGDAIAICLLRARGFTEADFALFHPSGAIGRRLLMRLCDVMRRDRKIALAKPELSVREALGLMTEARAGCVCIVDDSGALTGIFTDGDLRRKILVDPQILENQLHQVMTRNPVSLNQSSLAVEALKVFDATAIDDLVVVDDDGHPVGLIDSQDLPKLKLL
jgi:arabinose-5-phosphate isomerase